MEDEDQKWHERVDPASPLRCQANASQGDQCSFRVWEHEGKLLKYCKMHANGQIRSVKKEAKRLYALQRYRQQVNDLDQDTPNLDEELGIQRFVLQELLNRFEGVELITQSGRVSQLVKEIRETMMANLKLKSAMGQLMDRLAITKLCDAIVHVAHKHVPSSQMDAFAADVAGEIAKAVSERMN